MVAALLERECRAALAGRNLESAVAFEPVQPDDDRQTELLSPYERVQLAAIGAPKRHAEWLAGRVAAKRAALALLGPHPPTDVDCRRSAGGAPQIFVAGVVARHIAVAISHAGGVAGAFAARRTPSGLDIEPIAAVDRALARCAFTKTEHAWVAAPHSEIEGARRALCIWTAREAVLKALRIGLRWPPARVELELEAGRASACGAVFSIYPVLGAGYVATIATGRD